jgi:[acyl-carrier-protein] S-malonyltransferase
VLHAVLWEDSVRYIISLGFTDFYEIGPGRVLRGLMKRIDRGVNCQNVEA